MKEALEEMTRELLRTAGFSLWPWRCRLNIRQLDIQKEKVRMRIFTKPLRSFFYISG